MDDLVAEFLIETNESIAELDLALVKLERAPDDAATLSLIFRLVHTIKGACGFLGLSRLAQLTHAAENVLGKVRDKALVATPGVIGAVLSAIDRIRAILAGLAATGAEPAGDDRALIDRLAGVASGQAGEAPAHVAPAETDAAAGSPARGAQTIRVGVDVLDELMTLVGELALTRDQLLQLCRAGGAGACPAPLQRLSRIAENLQDSVAKTRMQPIRAAWNKFPRLVRDLAHATGKKIALDMHGQDIEVDRQVLVPVRDALTHMLRNSADHGIEPLHIRRESGKPETGRITLTAHLEGGHVVIEVEDDGFGLDVGAIRAKALANGLAREAELTAMTEQQIKTFIFRAGFSTASAVTPISGRGVGMDVVRSNIERIGGTVELASIFGQGTRFTIRIPRTPQPVGHAACARSPPPSNHAPCSAASGRTQGSRLPPDRASASTLHVKLARDVLVSPHGEDSR
jgi:two-component system chemotaxis sensor kinase CheA